MSKFLFFLVMVGVCTAAQAICPQDFYDRIENEEGPRTLQYCLEDMRRCELRRDEPSTKYYFPTNFTLRVYGLQTTRSISKSCEVGIHYLLLNKYYITDCDNALTWADRIIAEVFSTQASYCGTCPPEGWLDTWRAAFGYRELPNSLDRCLSDECDDLFADVGTELESCSRGVCEAGAQILPKI